ncbi:MAG: carbohydrate kinase [Bacteroidaceae bacterium]|nr:carbohydrate kinase [Bacteroidaceae bacterium]
MNKIVVGMGEALWDCLPDGRKLGGAPANFAYHVSQFGLESCVVSAVGSDLLGREITDIFTAKHLPWNIPTVEYSTGTVQVTLDCNGIPQYNIKENVAWDNIPFTPALEELAKQTTAICWGSLAQRNAVSRNTINSFIDAMPATEDVLKVFDINLRQGYYTKEIIEQSFEKCNILKINDEELVAISRLFGAAETTKAPDAPADEIPSEVFGSLDFKERCKAILKKYDLKMLILTCGVNGSYVFTPNGDISYQGTPKVTVADTVGAGDSFTATFVASILLGKSVREAHERAVKVSAFVCTQNGAMPIIPDDLK